MGKRMRKLLAMVLALSMLTGMLVPAAFAEEPDGDNTAIENTLPQQEGEKKEEPAGTEDTELVSVENDENDEPDGNKEDIVEDEEEVGNDENLESSDNGISPQADEEPELTGLVAAVASGATSYTLTADEVAGNRVAISGRDFVLDLGGHTLTVGCLKCTNGSLTIQNGTIQMGEYWAPNSNGDPEAMVLVLNFTQESKNVQFSNVTFIATNKQPDANNFAVEVEGIIGKTNIEFDHCDIDGIIYFYNSEATLTDCTLDMTGYNAANPLFDVMNSNVTVKGGKYTGVGSALFDETRPGGTSRNSTVTVKSGTTFENVGNVADFVDPSCTYDAETGEVAALVMAEVNGTTYPTLQDAIDAAGEMTGPVTVTLLKDGKFTDLFPTPDEQGNYKVSVSDLTIDLGTHTISEIPNGKFILYYDSNDSGSGANMTLKNGTLIAQKLTTEQDKLATTGYGSYVLMVTGGGTNATAYLKDLTTIGGISSSGNHAVELTNVKATGTNYYAVCSQNGGRVIIHSGEYGKIALQEGQSYQANHVLWVGADNNSAGWPDMRGMTIKGGAFTTAEGGQMFLVSKGVQETGFIEGGKFNVQPDEKYLAPDLVWKEADGWYTPAPGLVSIIHSSGEAKGTFTSIQEAIDAWNNDEHSSCAIYVKMDTTENVAIPAGKSVKIKTGDEPRNGEPWQFTWTGTVTNNGSIYFEQYSRVDVTVNNGEGAVLDYNDIVYSTHQFVNNGEHAQYAAKWYYTAEEGWFISSSSSNAKIGERLYADAQTAINAAGDGETVTLTSGFNANLVIPEGKNITLDLNGNRARNGSSDDSKTKPVITNNGTLTIVDGKNGRNGLCQQKTPTAALIENNGTLTIESGKIAPTNTLNNQTFSGSGTVIVNGGTFTQDVTNDVTVKTGYELVKNGSVWTVETIKVAQVGDTKYPTLQAAIDAAAEGDTVTLLTDIAESVTVAAGKTVTLDLNGKTLRGNTGHTITNKGTLTIIDSAFAAANGDESKMGKIVGVNVPNGSTTSPKIALENNGICNILSGMITRAPYLDRGDQDNVRVNSNYTVHNTGSLTVSGGKIINNSQKSAMVSNYGQTLIVEGGELDSANYTAIQNQPDCELTIKGGKIKGGTTSPCLSLYGTTNIEDGANVEGWVQVWTYDFYNNSETVTHLESVLNIKGGTLTDTQIQCVNGLTGFDPVKPETIDTTKQYAVWGTEGSKAQINITGGKLNFTGGIITCKIVNTEAGNGRGIEAVANGDVSTIWVSGGTFQTEIPAEYCAEGFLPVKNADGTYGVEEAELSLSQTALSLTVGYTASPAVTLTVAPDNLTGEITWASDNEAVATVANGVVTAVGEGSAIITVTVGGKTATCAVTVTRTYAPYVPPVIPTTPGEELDDTDTPLAVRPWVFVDVKENDWFYGDVKTMFDKGMVNGMTETTYEPFTATTRAMVATLLYRMAGEPSVEELDAAVADVTEQDWYYKAATWAFANGVFNGYADGTFQGAKSISREELAAVLRRYAAAQGKDVTGTAGLEGFPDANGVSAWALEDMMWAVSIGLINGRDGNLAAGETANRAELATLLVRFEALLSAEDKKEQ